MRHRVFLVGLLAGFLLLFSFGEASEAGMLSGVIVDTSGAVLPGVTATLAPAEAEEPALMAVSDAQGGFEFTGLAAGRYRLDMSLPGFEEKTLVVTLEKATTPVTLKVVLELATLSETVTVRDEVKLVDVQQVSGEEKVQEQVLEAAPLAEERFQDSLPLLPSVVRGPDGLININGARSSQSGLLLNGANVTDPLTGDFALNLPLDAVESVQVFQSVYSAEFGKVTSGMTNVLTRAGSDKWKFSFNNFFPRFRNVGGKIRGIDKATPRFRLSGPLARGNLWFSQAVNYRFVRSRVDELPLNLSEEILESFDSITQIDYQPNARNLLTGIFTVFPSDIDNLGINTLRPFQASPDLKTRGFNASLAERATLGKDSVLETVFSVQKFDLAVLPKSEETPRLTVERLEGNYFNEVDRDSLRLELRQSLVTRLRRGSHEHTLKLGYDLARTTYDGTDRGLPVDVLRGDGSRFLRIEWVGDPVIGASNTEVSAFLQDRWRPSERLQLDLGVRYDHERIATEHHLAPRLSVSYSPFADSKTVFKGGFGLFYDKIFLNVRDYERHQRRVLTFYGPDGITSAGPPAEFRNNIEGGNLHVPRSTNWHVEVDRLIGERFMLRTKYSERHGSNELLVEPIASGPDGPELRLASRGSSRTREIEFTVRARFGSESELFFSYVRARTEGDLNNFASIFGNIRSPIILANEFSLQPFDHRNRFLAWGVVNLPRGITLSPVLEIHDGFPYTVIDETQAPVGQRNRGGRFPLLATLDLKVTKDVHMPFKHWRAKVGFQLFNLLNRFNPRDIQNNLDSRSFGTFANSVDRQVRGKFTLLF
ncbi:MAG: TonB-dependent receptor domain-containing protein [Acidobacteriota bacterium]